MPPEIAQYLSGPIVLFLLFGGSALVTGITMVLFPNPVRSALFLVLNLFCVAVLYLLLNAYFLATVQVIVYAGAIMVLFLFVIMLLNLGTPDRSLDKLRWQQPAAVGIAVVLAALFGAVIYQSVPAGPPASAMMVEAPTLYAPRAEPNPMLTNQISDPNQLRAITPDTMGTVTGIGQSLYNPGEAWLFPFEATSILLLIAVIGSVVLAKRRLPGEDASAAGEREGGTG
ncbi:MAG: NADH-quinone oxidoreductase subunit J [Cytophagales bacterium]|nr:NADH-quinone oxidoreductase subunit J [Armatimonadota bacterium]